MSGEEVGGGVGGGPGPGGHGGAGTEEGQGAFRATMIATVPPFRITDDGLKGNARDPDLK